MNDILIDLKQDRAELVKSMEDTLTIIETEKRELTPEEETKYKDSETKLESLDKRIARLEKISTRKEQIEAVINPIKNQVNFPNVNRNVPNDEEFTSLQDFMGSVIKAHYGTRDARLEKVEYREQQVTVGAQGGFMVPAQFRPELMSLAPEATVIRGRATIIPAGEPPDAPVILNALDQRAAKNMYGGVVVTWLDEGGDKPETDFALRQITLTPHEVAAHIVLTDKLIRNWSAAGALAANQLRMAMKEAEEVAFLNGSGAGQPFGVLQSPCILTQNRATANTIAYADVVNMLAKFYDGMASPVWVASPTIKPSLMQMVDASSRIIWQPDARVGNPGTLLGVPIVYKYRQPGLGVTGDLMLADFSAYVIKDGSGPFVAMSDQVHFLKNKTVIKAFWNVDGSPWLTEPIVPSTSNSTALASPFVVLSSQV